jgi:hypothetical protein
MRLDILIAIEAFRRVFGFAHLPQELERFKPLGMQCGESANALYHLRDEGLLKPASGPPWPVELSLDGVEWMYSVATAPPRKRNQKPSRQWAERYVERQEMV